MKFVLDITCENAAFVDNPGDEIARILREVASQVEMMRRCGITRDANGNKVGSWAIDDDE